MDFQIRPIQKEDITAIVDLSLLAWEPVFQSFEQVLGPKIFSHIYPDWRKTQAEVVEKYCQPEEGRTILVAEVAVNVAGFLVYELREKEKTGEVILLAVHPDYQKGGIATALNKTALQAMKTAGMQLAEVGTGGDEGHAPARRAYEKVGYIPLPIVRYYQNL